MRIGSQESLHRKWKAETKSKNRRKELGESQAAQQAEENFNEIIISILREEKDNIRNHETIMVLSENKKNFLKIKKCSKNNQIVKYLKQC